jgi:DNA polymerase III sliding clamp (beta) subunit (PCNA family)
MSDQDHYSLSIKAAESLETFRGVERDASDPPQLQTPASAGNKLAGIVKGSADSGENVSVVIHGPTRLELNSSVNEGEKLTCGTSGKGQTATSGDSAIITALEDGASGDKIEVFVTPQANDLD